MHHQVGDFTNRRATSRRATRSEWPIWFATFSPFASRPSIWSTSRGSSVPYSPSSGPSSQQKFRNGCAIHHKALRCVLSCSIWHSEFFQDVLSHLIFMECQPVLSFRTKDLKEQMKRLFPKLVKMQSNYQISTKWFIFAKKCLWLLYNTLNKWRKTGQW